MPVSVTRRLTGIYLAAQAVANVRYNFAQAHVIITSERSGVSKELEGLDGTDVTTARNYITSLLAGYAAELRAGGDPESARLGADGNFALAEETLRILGESLEDALVQAHEFVNDPKNWKAIELLTDELLQHKKLDDAEIDLIVDVADGEPDAPDSLVRYRRLRDA